MRCIIAGSRKFKDYDLLLRTMSDFIDQYGLPSHIISGCAKGADQLGEQFAKDVNIECIQYPAHRDTHGKGAGCMRNKRNIEMANNADALVVFHFEDSRGTAHMIAEAKKHNLTIKVVTIYEKHKQYEL